MESRSQERDYSVLTEYVVHWYLGFWAGLGLDRPLATPARGV